MTGSTGTYQVSSGSSELARFFSGLEKVEIRAELKPRQIAGGVVRETVTVEFASAEHAIFLSALPLEFDDLVQLDRPDGKGRTEARVIAVQYHQGRKAVAVQFANAETSWVNRP